jgi:hypothetical protein
MSPKLLGPFAILARHSDLEGQLGAVTADDRGKTGARMVDENTAEADSDKTDELVSFGKYRGQPESVMMADEDYCRTIAAWPGGQGAR